MPTPLTRDAAAVRADRRTLLLAAGTVMTVFAVGAAAQTAWVYGNQDGMVPVGSRILANLSAVASMLLILAVTGVSLPQRGSLPLVVGVLSAGITASGVRFASQLLLDVYVDPSREVISTELVSGAVVAWIAASMGLAAMLSQRRLRAEVAERAEARLQIELALAALQHEEVRVRREVAEGLHGSMQQRLVLVVARLDGLIADLGTAPARSLTPDDVALLREVREQIETVREADVRTTSRMLYPEQLEVGMVPAIRALLGRIPRTVNTRLGVSDEVRVVDDPADPRLTRSERLLAVRVVEEAISNALRHGQAEVVDVRVSLVGDALEVRVSDDGDGFGEDAGQPSGTARLADRLRLVGGDLRVTSVPGDGTQVVAHLPVESLRGAAL
ncbi:ATP-binding protein [Cellulomonas sp. ACRRI]|uniref:sensor histidine kinase n=1 Tax=Cellulomonas sp. ACRRI TaxID=2918188 RepID=UPI001EF1B79C|nr:ATP-binding protein [Cellulomonas sp. ACRRI]MCG7287205.1 ATP-binding protein [Cellulomonas sp. ACRRI]